jgi:hypothetical protein
MNIDEKVATRLHELIELGKKVLATKKLPGRNVAAHPSVKDELFYHWKAGSLSFLKIVFGETSTHYELFNENCKRNTYPEAVQGYSVLLAAKEDIEQGFLTKLETLVAAEVFSDFFEIADHLIENGYKDPAASLLGAVLEDGLRKIAKNNGVTVKERESINSLNQKLSDADVYNRLIQKRVKVWEDIRNYADHGHFEEYTKEHVLEMKTGITGFLAEYLST